MGRDYFLAREIRKKVNLAVSWCLCSGVLESVTWQCDRVLRRVKMASESVLLNSVLLRVSCSLAGLKVKPSSSPPDKSGEEGFRCCLLPAAHYSRLVFLSKM